MLLALIVGLAMFKRRVGDVYFSIVTQAIAAILTILIIGQQGLTGGVNGITDLRTLMGWDIRSNEAKTLLYFVCACLLLGCILIGRFMLASKLGRLLMAMRDKEERVRFSGYDVASFKIFVFCVGACRCSARYTARCWSTTARHCSPKASPSCGFTSWAACSSPW